MSTIPKSPPETPSTPIKRASSQQQNGPLRSPVQDEMRNRQSLSSPGIGSREGVIVQVPATVPMKPEDRYETKIKESLSQNQHQNNRPLLQSPSQNTYSGRGHSRSSSINEHVNRHANGHKNDGDSFDLQPFDWDDLQRQYGAEFQKIHAEETEILEEFNRLSDSFATWAEVSANREDARVSKRLCTQARFVKLEEDGLEAKKLRYTQVVGAFKQALEMLRTGMPS